MNILNKIRLLPEKKKKIVLWCIMFVVALFLFNIYIQNAKNTLKESEGTEFLDQLYLQKLQEQVNEAKEIIFNDLQGEK